MWGVGALLAAALALVVIAAAPGVGDAVRRAICVIVTLGQGNCGTTQTSAAEHVPTRPCVLDAEGHESMVEGTFVFVSAGTGEQWLVEKLSDGRYRVTRGTQGSAGVAAGVGLTVQGVWDDKQYGLAAAAGAAAKISFKGGEVYYASDDDGVAELLSQHAADVAKDNTVGDNGPVRWALDGIEDLAGGNTQLPEPDERYVEGGYSLSADAKATWLVAGGKASVGETMVLGARVGKDGTSTEYISATVSGEVAAGTWGGADDGSTQYAQLKAQGSVQAVVEIERNSDGDVTAVRTRLVTAYETRAADSDDDPSNQGYTERTVELPIRSDADRAIAMRYLASLGAQSVAGMANPVVTPVLNVLVAYEAIQFTEAAKDRGFMTEQSFDADSSSYGAEVAGELIGKLGGSGQVTTVDRQSLGGEYFDGQQWREWAACA